MASFLPDAGLGGPAARRAMRQGLSHGLRVMYRAKGDGECPHGVPL